MYNIPYYDYLLLKCLFLTFYYSKQYCSLNMLIHKSMIIVFECTPKIHKTETIHIYLKLYRYLKLRIYPKLNYLKLHIYTMLYMHNIIYVTRYNILYTVIPQ